jgi:peptidoglycan hydrolase-like protein with peptidoglycan-binding domain
MTLRRRLRKSLGGWPAICVILLTAGPIVLLIGLESVESARLDGVSWDRKPVLVSPEDRTLTGERSVQLRSRGSRNGGAGARLARPRDEVLLGIGDTVTTGTPLIEIDGVHESQRLDRPFYRTLELGDKGDDVVALNSLLIRLGYSSAAHSEASFDAGTAQAVRQLQTQLGFQQVNSSFRPEIVVWLSHEPLVVAELRAVAGAPAPPAGSPLFVSKGSISSAVVKPADPRDPDVTFEPGGRWLLSVVGLALPVQDQPALDESARQAVSRALTTETTSLLGTLRLESPLKVTAIPASAVMTGATGDLCVWVEGADGFDARAVEVGGSARGISYVGAGLKGDERVLSNPAQILEDASCPSN